LGLVWFLVVLQLRARIQRLSPAAVTTAASSQYCAAAAELIHTNHASEKQQQQQSCGSGNAVAGFDRFLHFRVFSNEQSVFRF